VISPRPQNGADILFEGAGTRLSETVTETLLILRRRFLRIVLFGLLFGSIALALSMSMDRVYKSSIQLMIDRPVASPIDAEPGQVVRADNGYIDGQVLQIKSDDLLLEVVDRAGLTDHPEFQSEPPSLIARMIQKVKGFLPASTPATQSNVGGLEPERLASLKALEDAVSVRREGDTNVVTIEVHTSSPELAMLVATAIADAYRDMRLRRRDTTAREISAWIDDRADELRDDLVAAENAVTAYRIENGLIGEFNGASLGDRQLTELNAELIRSSADLAQKRASYELARAMLEGDGDLSSLPEVQNSAIISELRQTRLELQRSEQDLSQISGTDNPRVAQIRRQAALIDTQIDQEVRRIASVLENETRALESRTALLTQALERAGGQSEMETQNTVELRELERIAEAYRSRYERYLNNAGLAAELQTFASSGTQVVKSANFPTAPIYPPRKVFLVLGVLFGVAVAIFSIMMKEALAKGYRSAGQVERDLGIKVLSTLPEADFKYNGTGALQAEPFSPFSEAISVLRQRLRLNAASLSTQSHAPLLLVTSPEEGDGKTSVSAAVAASASSAGLNVLLVDGDLRYAGVSALFDMDGGEGLSDVLRGRTWLPPTRLGKCVLDVMPAGNLDGSQPADLLESRYLAQFLKSARTTYDLVIVDAPPVANLADSLILSDICSDLVLVFKAEETSKDAVRSALKRLPEAKIAGIVVNFVDPDDKSGRWMNAQLYSTSRIGTAGVYQLGNVGAENKSERRRGLADGAA
jgi:capsular exopolysaccharide synthesis family protein